MSTSKLLSPKNHMATDTAFIMSTATLPMSCIFLYYQGQRKVLHFGSTAEKWYMKEDHDLTE